MIKVIYNQQGQQMDFFLFHRDLRITDNVGLQALLQTSKKIALIFILTDTQIKNNPLFNPFAYNYLLSCLQILQSQVTVNIFHGTDEISVMRQLIAQYNPHKIYTNYDWTPFSCVRDQQLATLCHKNNIEYKRFNDYLLFVPGSIMSPRHEMYKSFRFFYEQILTKQAMIAKKHKTPNFNFAFLPDMKQVELAKIMTTKPPVPLLRTEVFTTIQNLDLVRYSTYRDYINEPTTALSTALKYGVISCRELVFALKKNYRLTNNSFFRQFCFREYYYHTTYWAFKHNAHQLGANFLPLFNNYKWDNNPAYIQAWQTGATGYLLVDAGMRYLNETGLMPNRLRMIVASFLIKNLHVDWRIGARYFAQKLLDYDPIVNEASWQWVAGSGFESNPFFRIFNVNLQTAKFDPDHKFIVKVLGTNYKSVAPIVDLKTTRTEALKRYADLKKTT